MYFNTRPKIHNNNVLDHEHLLGVVLYCYTNTQPKIHNNNVLDHEHLLEVVHGLTHYYYVFLAMYWYNSIKLPLVSVHGLTHYYYVFLAVYWYKQYKTTSSKCS
jgi:hypothetical protein